MSTHFAILRETNNNNYAGTIGGYDGHPNGMVEAISEILFGNYNPYFTKKNEENLNREANILTGSKDPEYAPTKGNVFEWDSLFQRVKYPNTRGDVLEGYGSYKPNPQYSPFMELIDINRGSDDIVGEQAKKLAFAEYIYLIGNDFSLTVYSRSNADKLSFSRVGTVSKDLLLKIAEGSARYQGGKVYALALGEELS